MQKQSQFNSFPQIVGTLRGRESLSAALSFLSLFQLVPSLGPFSAGFTFHHNIPKWDGRKHKTKPKHLSLLMQRDREKDPDVHTGPQRGERRHPEISENTSRFQLGLGVDLAETSERGRGTQCTHIDVAMSGISIYESRIEQGSLVVLILINCSEQDSPAQSPAR